MPAGKRRSARKRTKFPTGGKHPVDVHIGARLRERRIEQGLSQTKLGDAVGLTFQQIQKYERGANRIGSGRLYHFAGLLGVEVTYFFQGLPDTASGDIDRAAEEEARRLAEAFAEIADPNVRKENIALAYTVAGSSRRRMDGGPNRRST